MKKKLILSCVALTAFAAGQAAAAVYTDSVSFLDDVQPGAFINAFDDIGGGQVASLSYTDGTYSYDIGAVGGGANDLFNDVGAISTNSAVDAILVTFTSGNVTAVGGNFWGSDINFNPNFSDITINLSDGTTESFSSTGPTDFRGFTSNVVITSISIDADDTFANSWATMDNLIVGAAVPAPGTAALLGLGGLVATRRRR